MSETVIPTMPPNPTLRAMVEAVFRHGSMFAATAGSIFLIAVLVTLFTPRTYLSEMDVLVRNQRPDYLLTPERSTGQVQQTEVTEEGINSEVEVLKSRDLADEVLDPRWLTEPLASHTDREIRAHETSVTKFEKNLNVEPVRKSNVIRATYLARSPREAAETLQRLLAAFLEKQRDIERSPGASAFFASEADRYKRELDDAERQLADFQQSRGIVSLSAREATFEGQINALEDQMRSTQVQLTDTGDRVASDLRQLASTTPRQPTMQRSIPNTEAISQLSAALNTYQNRRTELLQRYQPTDRLVVEVNRQIADTSAALAAIRAGNSDESTTDVNPVYQQLKAALATSTADEDALRGRLADQTAQRDRLRRQLSGVEGATVDYGTLETRVTELQNNYQLYTQKKNEAAIADAMNQHQLLNVAVSEQPTFSARPYRPVVWLNLGMGLFAALFAGACVVFFAELGRETICAPYELEEISKAPVLATIPLVEHGFARGFAGESTEEMGPGARGPERSASVSRWADEPHAGDGPGVSQSLEAVASGGQDSRERNGARPA